MNKWNISEAKSRFTQVVVSSRHTPQIICKRDKPVSAIINIDLFNEFMALKENKNRPTIAQLLDELKVIRNAEQIDIEIPARHDRSNPFEETPDEMDL